MLKQLETKKDLVQKAGWKELFSQPQFLITVITLLFGSNIATNTGLIKPIVDFVQAHQANVQVSRLQDAKRQKELWETNTDCLIAEKPKPIGLLQNTKLELLVCPSGNALLTKTPIPASFGKTERRWIDFTNFDQTATNFFTQTAIAATTKSYTDFHKPLPEQKKLAQNTQVICAKVVEEGRLVRIVRQNNICYKEIINTFTGNTISRQTTSCNSSCS